MLPYWSLIYTLRVLFALFTRFRVRGLEHIPSKGAFVLVSNHISHFDPPVFSAACARAIDWVGAEMLFRTKWGNACFRALNVIPVRQYEADHGALREAIRRVKAGRGAGLYPEGGIRAGEASLLGSHPKLYQGGFMISAMTGAPLLPCLVVGSDRLYNPWSLLKRPPIWVCFGKPILSQGRGRDEVSRLEEAFLSAVRGLAGELRATGETYPEDWPQTPQQRNPRIEPPREPRAVMEDEGRNNREKEAEK
ncbi:MAG: lysophospholipid acyltransferase family protein [Verrucomicrobiae bacterium]|nr:lysophospholipid acyltransferase family protein [Verrucomicrobiae bacterium]